jgi:hypothetical protein
MPRARVIILLALAAALATSSPAWGAPADGGIELVGGSGRSIVTLRGAALGTVELGRITVSVRAGEPRVIVQGHEWQRETGAGTVYGGSDIRFRVFRGSWRVIIQGNGINASAVGDGTVRLRGTGRYSIDGAAYAAWPAVFETIRLAEEPS